MKKITVILSHPSLDKESLMNKTIKDAIVKAVPQIEYRYLDDLYPNGMIDVSAEQDALVKSDVVVFQFPVFWYSVPALLKSYMDKVLEDGFAYGEGGDKLKGKKMFVVCTTGSNEISYSDAGQPENYNKQSIEKYLFFFARTTEFTGMADQGIVCAYSVGQSEEFVELNKKSALAVVDKLLKMFQSKNIL